MINKDDELESYVRIGKDCNFLEKYNEFVEISAQKIRELLLDPKINNVRITGAVITDTLDLRDTLSAEGSPLGGLELINCIILEPMRLERSHLTHLSLLQSAFTELHAQNCRIEGPVDLGYVYSREEPESRSFKDNPEYSNDNCAIDEAFKNIPVSDKGKTGLSGPENWWKYETALEIKPDSHKTPRGRCQVDLSEASIGGSLYLDGCRMVAAAIDAKDDEKKELTGDPSNPAIDLSNARIDGDCIVRGGHVPRDGSVISATSGSFLGKFTGKNLCLQGDFWGCGGIYWGYFDKACFFQGARIRGGVFFQEIETDQSSNNKQSKAVIRGEVNFLAARIEGWADLTGLYCLHPAFCLRKEENNINNTLLNFATATIGSNFQLKIEDKSETNLHQIIDLRSMKVSGDFSISIENYSENNPVNISQLIIESSEVKGEFKLEGDIDSFIFANNMYVGSLSSMTATFRKGGEFIGLNVDGDVEFYSIIHKTVDLTGIRVRGSLCLSSDLESEKGYPRSLKLVHQINSDEWRSFAELQSDTLKFLNKCFNDFSCGLILKHAVIEKELRIHHLQTDLGDTDTNSINWTGRIREFFRTPLRYVISNSKKYRVDSFSMAPKKWAQNQLDRLYGISSKRIKIALFSDELTFYPGFYWVRCYVEQSVYDRPTGGLIDCLWNPVSEKIVILGGNSAPVHELNQQGKLTLETEGQIKDYLRFFCECVWGDQGPFHIYEIPHALDNDEISKLKKEIEITGEKPQYWIAKAHVIYADHVFNATFRINKNGSVEMVEDDPIQDGVERLFEFAKPYCYARYKFNPAQSRQEATLMAVRPIQLKLNSFYGFPALPKWTLMAAKLSEQLEQSLEIKTQQLHAPFSTSFQKEKESEVVFCSEKPLSFYPDYYWIRVYIEQKSNGDVSGGLIDCLWNPVTKEIVIVGGKSLPIHQLNQQGKLKLENHDQVKDYLRFFCECVWGDEGPFHIYEKPHDLDNDEIKKLKKVIEITKENPEYWIAKAHVIYADYVFNATFHIYKNGLIEMVENEPIQDGVNVRFQFSESYRYDSRGKNATLKAVRPMQIELLRANDEKVIGVTSSAALKKRLTVDNVKFPDPPKISLQKLPDTPKNNNHSEPAQCKSSYWQRLRSYLSGMKEKIYHYSNEIFYSNTGGYRRWLDRFGFSLPMQLPVIDLRGAHAETLNDKRGNGWRFPIESNGDWLNYGIFLRLEGFSFNRLIHIIEPKKIIEKKEISYEEFTPRETFNKNSEFKSFDSPNDQNWRPRVGWLYRQYPQSVPDPYTFDQQPFSQVIKAYRSRGDIANFNGILRAKISIEFMLFAQRVTPSFLLAFSFFAGIVFMIATLTMTSSVNENLMPVVWGMVAGALGTLIFCWEQDKLDRNYFIFLIVPAVLVITYFASGLLFSDQSVLASVFFTQMLFLSVVIWGILGRLFVYFFQIIYWICFDYGLSIFRALLTILICLAIGAWGVNTVNNDKKFLVLNVDYSTPFVDSEGQPRYVPLNLIPENISSVQPIELDQTVPVAKCGDTIDPFVYALDVFISLVDFRQEILCNLRSAKPFFEKEENAEWSLLLKETTWDGRRKYLWEKVFNTDHPQMWVWLAAAYTILGWVVISLTILTIARNIKNYLSDNNQ